MCPLNFHRAVKRVYRWGDGDWEAEPDKVVKFVYAGPLLVAELDGNDTLLRSYTWGRDLSGGLAGAGGIGGLMAVKHHAGPLAGRTFWPVCDDQGNVVALVDADAPNHPVVASMEYGPFGELIAVDGVVGLAPYFNVNRSTLAELCPLLFSTKYLDAELAPSGGLYYYGYRYYEPTAGKWLSRDPIAEEGGLNLYAFKDPVNTVDPEGLDERDDLEAATAHARRQLEYVRHLLDEAQSSPTLAQLDRLKFEYEEYLNRYRDANYATQAFLLSQSKFFSWFSSTDRRAVGEYHRLPVTVARLRPTIERLEEMLHNQSQVGKVIKIPGIGDRAIAGGGAITTIGGVMISHPASPPQVQVAGVAVAFVGAGVMMMGAVFSLFGI